LIEINLAPGAEPRRASRPGRAALKLPNMPDFGGVGAVGIGAGAIVILLAVGFLFWRLTARQSEIEVRVQQEITDSMRFATTIALINSLQQRQDTIQAKIEVIRSVDQRRYVWPHILDELGQSVPEYTWLTEVVGREEDVPAPPPPAAEDTTGAVAAPYVPPPPIGPSFTIQGNAGSTQALTRLMKNMETSPFIRGVTLVTSEQVDVEGRTIHRFTVEARYETPDSSVIRTVPVVVVN
jgi:Tfp pilus assembly protein PilN